MTAAAPERFIDSSDLPLHGIKVLELAHMIMGSAAGLVLADLGAEVIKVEPVEGDRTRLALQADMLVENFRDDSLAQYGLDYASLSAANPRLICVSLRGFLFGPYKQRTALDEVVRMMGGLAYINGGTDAPQRVAASVNNILCGTLGVVGALAR